MMVVYRDPLGEAQRRPKPWMTIPGGSTNPSIHVYHVRRLGFRVLGLGFGVWGLGLIYCKSYHRLPLQVKVDSYTKGFLESQGGCVAFAVVAAVVALALLTGGPFRSVCRRYNGQSLHLNIP